MSWLHLAHSASTPTQGNLDFWTPPQLRIADPDTQATDNAAMKLRLKIQKVLETQKISSFDRAIIAAYDTWTKAIDGINSVIEKTQELVNGDVEIYPNVSTLNLILACLVASKNDSYIEIKRRFMDLVEITELKDAKTEDIWAILESFKNQKTHH